ncbi:transcription regulator LysR family protein [Clostridia bacterium]|nr:transcription regulator LysR family protein [Clostridia bacterium]
MASLDHYRVFLAAASAGSIKKAAEKLYISQPAVSLSIAKLEESLGVMLFLRKHEGVTLTGDGEALLAHVKRGLSSIDAGERAIKERKTLLNGSVHVALCETASSEVFVPVLKSFAGDHPDIAVFSKEMPHEAAAEQLMSGKCDIAILAGPLTAFADGNFDKLQVTAFHDAAVVSAKGNLYSGSDFKMSAAELLRYPLALPDESLSLGKHLMRYFSAHELNPTPRYTYRTPESAVKIAMAELAVSVLPAQFADWELDSGNLVMLHIDPPIPKRGIFIVKLREINLSDAASDFVARVKKMYY